MNSRLNVEEIRQKAAAYIDAFVARGDCMNWWNGLLLATAKLNDRFDILKEIVAKDHLLPQELLPGAKSVIVYFIPFRKDLVLSNIRGEMASRDWAQSYVDTNSLIANLNQYLSTRLADQGYKSAVTPATPPSSGSAPDALAPWARAAISSSTATRASCIRSTTRTAW